MNQENYNSKVAQYWGETLPDLEKTFYGFPALLPYQKECIAGEDFPYDKDWLLKWTLETYCKHPLPVSKCLSLCCGFGSLERSMAKLNVFESCLGLDISEKAITEAQKKAKASNIDNLHYQNADLNHIELSENEYDLIWANGALHHIVNLEHLTTQIHKALKPNGLFVCNEYIGPKHQKIPARQREIINAVFHLIPVTHRKHFEANFTPSKYRTTPLKSRLHQLYRILSLKVLRDQRLLRLSSSEYHGVKKIAIDIIQKASRLLSKPEKFRFGKVWDENSALVKYNDPSEGVRSDEIIPILKKQFSDLHIHHYNGSVLFYALDQQFFDTFDINSKEDQELLQMLIQIEKTMIEIGEIQSDHAHIVAYKTV